MSPDCTQSSAVASPGLADRSNFPFGKASAQSVAISSQGRIRTGDDQIRDSNDTGPMLSGSRHQRRPAPCLAETVAAAIFNLIQEPLEFLVPVRIFKTGRNMLQTGTSGLEELGTTGNSLIGIEFKRGQIGDSSPTLDENSDVRMSSAKRSIRKFNRTVERGRDLL